MRTESFKQLLLLTAALNVLDLIITLLFLWLAGTVQLENNPAHILLGDNIASLSTIIIIKSLISAALVWAALNLSEIKNTARATGLFAALTFIFSKVLVGNIIVAAMYAHSIITAPQVTSVISEKAPLEVITRTAAAVRDEATHQAVARNPDLLRLVTYNLELSLPFVAFALMWLYVTRKEEQSEKTFHFKNGWSF